MKTDFQQVADSIGAMTCVMSVEKLPDGSHVIQVPGEIRYVSEGTQMINTHTASMDEGLRGEGAPEDSFYLIYEKDEELYLQPGTDDQ